MSDYAYDIIGFYIFLTYPLRTVWSPVTDHYVNKVIFFSVNSKCQDCLYVADKGIISSNDYCKLF